MTENELASTIWNIKEIIRDDYDDAEVENVILPFTVLRRLDCVLESKYEKIKKEYDAAPDGVKEAKLMVLMKKHNLPFFNLSGLSLEKILKEPSKTTENFKTYLDGFTPNVKNILIHFVTKTKDDSIENDAEADIADIYKDLASTKLLYQVTEEFVKLDLHPDSVSNAQMGTIFEIVIQKSKESANAHAGQYFTPREIVHLLVSLVMAGKERELNEPGKIFNIYDPCCGTGGMLTEGKRFILQATNNPNAKINLYGQELNHKTYAIAKSDLLIKGDLVSEDQIRQGNTLSDDKISRSFNFMLANPPFGTDWSKVEDVIKKEHEKKGGRFDAGLPSTTDGSLLFLQHMISKMDKSGSRIGIVLNGSPLFNGDPGGGWSNIRKSFLDNNLLDAIVALPKNLFYGTDISTYLWILDNKRPENKKNKVLFIDASDKDTFASLLQRNIGKKRFEISEKGIEKVLKLYKNYKNASMEIDGKRTEVAKLLDYDEFFYTRVAICRPSKLKFIDFQKKLNQLWEGLSAGAKKSLERFKDEKSLNGEFYDAEFFDRIKEIIGKNVSAALAKDVRRLAVVDEDAPAIFATPGKPESGYVANTDLNDFEDIPKKEDVNEYFEREVVPFVDKSWMDRSKDKIGVEFPFTKLFYVYKPLRSNEEIFADLKALEAEADADFEVLMQEDK